MKSLRPTEIEICKAIARGLRIEKPKCFWTHVANESGLPQSVALRVGQTHKAMGKHKGVLDYLFLGMPTGYPIFWYEVKRKGKKPTYEQAQFIAYCVSRGIPCEWHASDDWMDHYQLIRGVLVATGAL